jgi:hypothetical protein
MLSRKHVRAMSLAFIFMRYQQVKVCTVLSEDRPTYNEEFNRWNDSAH